ncbi:hypothetical protein CAOG_04982 [Capsaspora owczarzaki ATCC 30864]|uniref:NB-ARC domain-containing protein n=1 Tax=Capsaspora owczarzaki (strain ATCC 30864) TaxID=595528 RepID=A0A0D2WSC3_CAPO3|nr:hypothetical protein CAOG_04982 [Capsaspora owczarzaki ATCC 30864]KJE94323.1 hypothetical protein CAOG_004982 [Capsaspora owczarzaki ATCC 30864]|eukprot:XP_004346667.2 hypothetical protein CAOG_04982 [Capsaspora owczarzaki ATCC 30864]
MFSSSDLTDAHCALSVVSSDHVRFPHAQLVVLSSATSVFRMEHLASTQALPPLSGGAVSEGSLTAVSVESLMQDVPASTSSATTSKAAAQARSIQASTSSGNLLKQPATPATPDKQQQRPAQPLSPTSPSSSEMHSPRANRSSKIPATPQAAASHALLSALVPAATAAATEHVTASDAAAWATATSRAATATAVFANAVTSLFVAAEALHVNFTTSLCPTKVPPFKACCTSELPSAPPSLDASDRQGRIVFVASMERLAGSAFEKQLLQELQAELQQQAHAASAPNIALPHWPVCMVFLTPVSDELVNALTATRCLAVMSFSPSQALDNVGHAAFTAFGSELLTRLCPSACKIVVPFATAFQGAVATLNDELRNAARLSVWSDFAEAVTAASPGATSNVAFLNLPARKHIAAENVADLQSLSQFIRDQVSAAPSRTASVVQIALSAPAVTADAAGSGEMALQAAAATPSKPLQARVCVIAGSSGVGKGQLALSYVQKHVQQLSSVYWMAADTMAAVYQGYQRLAVLLGMMDAEAAQQDNGLVAKVHSELDRRHVKASHPEDGMLVPTYAIVFENASASEHLEVLFEAGPRKGLVLITSREEAWARAAVWKCPAPSVSAASSIFARLLSVDGSSGDSAALQALVEKLQCIPLGLSLAAQLIQADPNKRLTVPLLTTQLGEALSRLNGTKLDEHDDDMDDDEPMPPRCLQALWSLISKAVQSNPISVKLLECMSFGGIPHRIPIPLLYHWIGVHARSLGLAANLLVRKTWAALMSLQELGIVSFDYDPAVTTTVEASRMQTVSMHPTVQRLVRSTYRRDHREEMVDWLVDALLLVTSSSHPLSISTESSVVVAYLPLLLACVRLYKPLLSAADSARIYFRTAHILAFYAQRPDTALSFFESSLAKLSHLRGVDSIEVGYVAFDMAFALRLVGDEHQASATLHQSLTVVEKTLASFDPDVAEEIRAALKSVKVGSSAAGLAQHLQHVLALKAQLFSDAAVTNVEHLFIMARLHGRVGEYHRKLDILRHTYEAAVASAKDPLSHTATALSMIGNTCRHLGQSELARLYLEKALALREKFYSSRHPNLAKGLRDIARVDEIQGDYDAAFSRFSQAHSIYNQLLPRHAFTAKLVEHIERCSTHR